MMLKDVSSNLQLALKIEHPKFIPELIEEIQNSMISFRTRFNGDNVEITNKKYDALNLPKNLKSMQDMCLWTSNNCYPYDKTLGTIAVNNQYIVFNTQHLVADGHALTSLASRLANGIKTRKITGLPISNFDIFKKEIEEAPDQKEYFDNSKKYQMFPRRKIQNTNRFDSVNLTIPIDKLQCFSKKDKKCHRISEAFWSAAILSGFALNNNFGKACILTVVDLRQFMKTKLSLLNLNMWSHVYEYAEPNINDEIETMYRKLRNDYNDNISKGRQFTFLKNGIEFPSDNLAAQVSSVGPIHIKPPIIDAFINSDFTINGSNYLINNTYSVIGNGKNDIHILTSFPPDGMYRKDAKRYSKMFEYCMKYISPNMRFKDVIDELCKIK